MKTKHLAIGLLPIILAISTVRFTSFQEDYKQKRFIPETLTPLSDLPVVYFSASVAQLRIRKDPDLNAPVIVTIPEGDHLKYLNETGGTPVEVTLRGVKHEGRWYKVSWEKYNRDTNNTKVVEGWVFSGGVVLSSIGLNGTSLDVLNFEFFKAKKISEIDFYAQDELFKNDYTPNPNPYAKKKGLIVLPLDNGKVKMISDSLCKEPTFKSLEYDHHYYTGQFPGLGLYLMTKECQRYEIPNWYLIRKLDGEMVFSWVSGIPIFSPDGQKMTLLFNEVCGSFRVDFGIFRNSNWTVFSITSDDEYGIDKVIWSQDSKQCIVKWNLYEWSSGKELSTEYYSISFGPQE